MNISDDIIALYKPYGLAVQGKCDCKCNLALEFSGAANFFKFICTGTRGDLSNTSLVDLLPDLADIFSKNSTKIEKLYTVHRLDKETTGVLLLAK